MIFCVLTMSGLGFMTFPDDTKDIWSKIGITGVWIFLGFIWFGISYVYTIADKDKCPNCGLAIKDDHRFCDSCDLAIEKKLRNTKEPLHCIVAGCDEIIDSVDSYEKHYMENHEHESIAEGICRPSYSKLRYSDVLYIKEENTC